MSQTCTDFSTYTQAQFMNELNLDMTSSGDISTVTSTDIQEMENVRNHLQNMMKSFKGFNMDDDGETSYSATVEGEEKGDTSATSVDTAAFLQKLLPNSSPMEEIRVHFTDRSRGPNASSMDQTLHSSALTKQHDDSVMSNVHHQSTDKATNAANRSLMSENGLLREHLDREKFRRKHCEQQIQELHSKMLELQQEVAVAVSSERKKDVMIEQLDKTLAKVVEGWKRHENEKLVVINALKQEREVQEQSHQKQQEMLLQFERELERAVEAFTKEQEKASEAEREKQEVIEKQAKEREELLQVLAKEKTHGKTTEEEKLSIIKDKEQAQEKYMEAQRHIEELSEKNLNMRADLNKIRGEFSNSLATENKKLEEERKFYQESKNNMASLQKEVQRLGMELDTTNREKESLKMEMSLMQARHEASKAKEETERQAELEKQMTQRLEELHQHMTNSESEMRESHRKQIQDINSKHKEEMHQQLEKFHEEIKRKDTKLKTASMEFEERITDAQDKIASLSNHRQQLENQRQNMTIRMHQMMQAHCDEALRLLSSNKSSPQAKSDGKVDFVSKLSPNGPSLTSKWQQQTSPPSSLFSNPSSTHSNSYKYHTPVSSLPSNVPTMNYHVSQSNVPPTLNYHVSQTIAPTKHISEIPSSLYNTQTHGITKHKDVTTASRYNSQNTGTLPNRTNQPSQYEQMVNQKDPRLNYVGGQPSLAAPMAVGYPTRYQETSIFSSYLGNSEDINEEMMRSGVDFVPLKTIQDDHDTDSVISALHGSPDSGPLNGTNGYPEMDYSKVATSAGSNGTLHEQDLEESHMSTLSPENQQRTQSHDISDKLQEQEQRQAELNHYVNMLLKRSPGHPYEEGLEQLTDGLMTIPSSFVGAKTRGEVFQSKVEPGLSRYPQQNSVNGSNSVSKDISKSVQQAFTKTTVPAAFTVQQQQEEQVSHFQHPIQPQTPPRRDKDPANHDTSTQKGSLSPKQMKQLSKLLSLMSEGQTTTGVQVPSAEQLFDVLKEMQKGKPSEPRPQSVPDQDGYHTSKSSYKPNISHVKRSLDTSFPPRKQKPLGPSTIATHEPTKTDQQKTRPPSVGGGPPQRSSSDQGLPRHQAPTKASSKHILPKPEKRVSQAKPSSVWK